jgi:hypothetical protein
MHKADRIISCKNGIGSCGSFFHPEVGSTGHKPSHIKTKPISNIRYVLHIYQGMIGQ